MSTTTNSSNYSTLCNENCASATPQKTFDFFNNLGLDWYQSRGKWPTNEAKPCGNSTTTIENYNYVTLADTARPSYMGDPRYSKNVALFVSSPPISSNQTTYLSYNYPKQA